MLAQPRSAAFSVRGRKSRCSNASFYRKKHSKKYILLLLVGNIPYDVTEDMLREIFSEAGAVMNFRLVYHRLSYISNTSRTVFVSVWSQIERLANQKAMVSVSMRMEPQH